MRKVAYILWIVLLSALASGARAQPLQQVITADEIQAAGIVRLSGVLTLIDGWTVVSMDGFRERVTPLGMGSWGDAGWELWVDGHPVDVDVLGSRTINRLPVLLQDISYVEVERGPGVESGPMTPLGRLHVHTRRPEEGVHARGSYWTGNEAGDPGPYKYLTDNTHNVDRLGPDFETTGELRAAWGWLRGQGLTRIHFPTDRALLKRIQQQLPRVGGSGHLYPKSEMLSGAVQVHAVAAGGEHDVWGGASDLNDYIYLEPYLREVPAHSRFVRIGARGHARAASALQIDYRVAATINQLRERRSVTSVDPSLRVATYRAGLEARASIARFDARLGARLRHDVAYAVAALADPAYTVATLYAGAARRGSDLQPSVALQAQVDGQNVALQGRLATTLRRGDWSWTTWLGYDEHLFDDTHRLWLWTRRGYPLLDTLGVAYALDEGYGEDRVLRLETALHLRLDTAWTAEAGAFVRDRRGLTLPQRTLTRYDADARYFEGVTALTSGAEGTVAGGYAVTRYQWMPRLRQHLFASVQHALRSDGIFGEAWRAQPVFQVHTRATYRAASTFTLHGSLSFRSRTRWPGLDEASALSGGAFAEEVPAAFVVDVAATKWLWDRHLRGTVGVRNVLNEAYHQHPLGAAFPLSLRIQVSAAL